MIVVDTSALCAIFFDETERPKFNALLAATAEPRLSAAMLVEAGIVITARKGDGGGRDLDLLILNARMRIEPVDSIQAALAREGFRHFGKGRHPAGLNFGDCFTYALAKTTGFPVLAKGPEFSRTDIDVVSVEG